MYTMKWAQETGWAVVVAVAVYVLTAIVESSGVVDAKAFGVAVAGGAVRIAAGAVLAALSRPEGPADDVPRLFGKG